MMRAFFCGTGHATECHYPMTCAQADCGHMAMYRESEPEDEEELIKQAFKNAPSYPEETK